MNVTWKGVTEWEGMYPHYRRLSSNQLATPPFTWEGDITLHEVMSPPVFGWGYLVGVEATYDPGVNFHPLYPSNDRNIVIGVGRRKTPTRVNVSAEMRDVRPERPYGVRTGYLGREIRSIPDPMDGKPHHFRWEVDTHADYRLYWDGKLACGVAEMHPATIDARPVPVGLRLDFCDVELGEMTLTSANLIESEEDMTIERRAPTWMKFMSAYDWGRELIHPMVTEKLNDPETYVHHTAGNPMGSRTAVDAMKTLERLSHNKGYATVAYDVVVHRGANGIVTVMEGRGGWRSAATKDRNEEGEAICLMGYFEPGNVLSSRPSQREIEGLAWGIAWMIEQGWSAKDTKILGHRDNPAHPNATACPGEYLYERLPDIRELVQKILTPLPPPTTPPTPPTEGDDTVLIGYVKHPNNPAVYRQFSNGTKTWITDGEELAVHQFVSNGSVEIRTMPNNAWMRATGVIVGPVPPGVDIYGQPQ